jgi:hypothetical protein
MSGEGIAFLQYLSSHRDISGSDRDANNTNGPGHALARVPL